MAPQHATSALPPSPFPVSTPTSGMVEATHQPPSDSNGSRAVRGIRRWPVPWDRL